VGVKKVARHHSLGGGEFVLVREGGIRCVQTGGGGGGGGEGGGGGGGGGGVLWGGAL